MMRSAGSAGSAAAAALLLLLSLPLATAAQSAAAQAREKTSVLTVSGDWKSQEWYQNVWMPGIGGAPQLHRGRLIAAKVEAVAPGKFEFTDITNYAGQEYLDAEYLSRFDVVLIGDVVGWSLNPRFQTAVSNYVASGGGMVYCASYKWHISMLNSTPFGQVLPAAFPFDSSIDEWATANLGSDGAAFAPAPPPDKKHPVTDGLNWASAPSLHTNFKIIPKPGAEVLLASPSGSPVLAAWQFGKGRTAMSGSLFANDELSHGFGDWSGFGEYYARLFAWLGENSERATVEFKNATAEVKISADFSKTLNPVPAGIFSVHGHETAGFPMNQTAFENFRELNMQGGFARFDTRFWRNGEDGDYHFVDIDKQLAEINRLGLRPIALMSQLISDQYRAWADGSRWYNPSDRAIEIVKEDAGALLRHVNGSKSDSTYKTNIEYFEILNEPDVNSRTLPGYAKLVNAVADYIHAEFPGVKVGAYGYYEKPYIKPFIDACGEKIDWISRHPYGWTGEMLFKAQDEIAEYAASKGFGHIKFIITEWDFWIQGRQKFDYMMKRNFEAAKREDLIGALHYRFGMYNEPIYLFGLVWIDWGQDRGAGKPYTPMHDAYDAFWIFRDFRGARAAVEKTASEENAAALAHVQADATRDGDALNLVVYCDWAYDGKGATDSARGLRFNKVRASLELSFPASSKARVMTISRATGEGFEVVKKDIAVPAGATTLSETIEAEPVTAYSIAIK